MTRLTGFVFVVMIAGLIASTLGERMAFAQQATGCAAQPYAEAQVPGAPRIQLEIALTPEQREHGLMDRESMPADQGMLFVFGQPSSVGFWMVDTLIPLSVAFLAPDGTIQDLIDMAPLAPNQAPIIYSPTKPYWYALEANQGWFANHGVAVGNILTLCYQ